MMNQERIGQRRNRLLARLPGASEILRGSLLQRTIRPRAGCPKCARGEYPTDSSLLGDGDRVLTRLIKKVTAMAGAAGTKLRDSMRSGQRLVAQIARASRAKGEKGKQKIAPLYRQPLEITGRVVGQAQLRGLRAGIDDMVGTVKKVVYQAKARVFGGDTHVEGNSECVRDFHGSDSQGQGQQAYGVR